MSYILGLYEYLDQNYNHSVFSDAHETGEKLALHVHGGNILQGKVVENSAFELQFAMEGNSRQIIKKTDIIFLHKSSQLPKIKKIIKIDKKIAKDQTAPIIKIKDRNHIKNKSLFPLMEERQVMIFTLLEGIELKGLITAFSRYEITLNAKGGLPITIFRHAVVNLADKKKRSFLKSFQQKRKDWQKSSLYVA